MSELRNRLRKGLALFLVLSIVLTQFNLSVFAEEINEDNNSEENPVMHEAYVVDPMWVNVFTEEDIARDFELEPVESLTLPNNAKLNANIAKPQYESFEELVEVVRNAQVNRESAVEYYYLVDPSLIPSGKGDVFGEEIWNAAKASLDDYDAAMARGYRISWVDPVLRADGKYSGYVKYTLADYFTTPEQEAEFEATLSSVVNSWNIYN